MSVPESTLNKKHNFINYHVVRDAVAARILYIANEGTAMNLVDPLTKLVPYSHKQELLGQIP